MAKVGPFRSSSPRRWAVAIAFSLLANSPVIGFFWALHLAPVDNAAAPIVISLEPPLGLPRLRPEAARRHPARSLPLAVRAPVFPTITPTTPVLPLAPSPTVAPPNGPDLGTLSGALRGALGCGLAPLTDAQRAACGAKLAANRPTVAAPLNFDPYGRYAGNPEPYLTRMPKNGCKARATGDATAFGKEGLAAGISCGWSF